MKHLGSVDDTGKPLNAFCHADVITKELVDRGVDIKCVCIHSAAQPWLLITVPLLVVVDSHAMNLIDRETASRELRLARAMHFMHLKMSAMSNESNSTIVRVWGKYQSMEEVVGARTSIRMLTDFYKKSTTL